MAVLFVFSSAASAQEQCGFASSIDFPIDTNLFRIAQDFGSPSPRHQGRYHTAEDWYGIRGESFGQPVRAIAAGRVTYSAVSGWGRDGGVVIIEHTFPDATVAYSMYGHMTEIDGVAVFPPAFACVSMGEIIGAVGDARPAPHLHFEIRSEDGNSAGPGYTWQDPVSLGWRRPSKFVRNWQTWLSSAYLWRLDLADEAGPSAPPAILDDGGLLYLDADRVGRLSSDGRTLWRLNLDRHAVGVVRAGEGGMLIYADGSMQTVTLDGTLSERRETGIALESEPITAGGMLLFHTPDNEIVAFDAAGQAELWRLDGIAPLVRTQSAAQTIGLITTQDELLTLSLQGELLDRARLRDLASLGAHAETGGLMAYARGGLWNIGADGQWSMALLNTPQGGGAGAMLSANGQIYLFDGRVLHAYNNTSALAEQALVWQIELPQTVTGMSELAMHDGILLLTSSAGSIIAVRAIDGGLCGSTQIYGDWRARAWHMLGADGVLRVAVADQIIGLDWDQFIGGCA